ncbi:DUF2291 family protein [Dryocola clanedunensis]|uniref:DUF2291 family protein n=1 Tax=Cedecea sulfonylureivorans TaxID=3051154 RepID=UPI0019280AF6|nr:DUF2291 domain-containing protein [Cedecea sulfonylureivorans]
MTRKIWLAAAMLALGGCRIVSQQELADLQSPPNPHMAAVAQSWKQKLVPQVIQDARPVAELLQALHQEKDFDTACQKLGYRSQDQYPCVFYVKAVGQVVDINTASRSGKLTLKDISGANVVVQIGPTIRGTQLRDGFKGTTYQDFNDQVLFGEYGRAINDQAVNMVQKAQIKVGETREIYGVVSTWDIPDTLPAITPVQIRRAGGQ